MDVRLEDGTIVKNVPEGTTKAQLLEKLNKAQPKARSSVDPLDEVRSLAQGATLGFSDEIGAAALAGVVAAKDLVTQGKNPIDTFKSEFPLMVDSIRSKQDQFAEENPEASLALNFAGGLATGAGAGKNVLQESGKQIVKQGAKTGAAFGTAAGAGFSDSDELLSIDTAINTAVGGVTGAALGAILPAATNEISKNVKRILRKDIKVIDDAGQFTDEALEELDKLFTSGKVTQSQVDDRIAKNLIDEGVLTPEQAKRFNLFKSRGVTPTRANITQSVDDFSQQQSLAKTSGQVADTIADQDDQLINLAREGVENLKPVARSLPEVNARVFSVVDEVVGKSEQVVSQAYQAAKQASQGQPRVSFNNLAKAISDNRGNEKVSGGIISAARGLLKNKGLIKKGSFIELDKRANRTSGEDLKKLTVNEAEEIRKGLNELFDSATPQGRRIIRKLKNAIDDDVKSAVGSDIFEPARQSKIQLQKLIERSSRDSRDRTRGSFLEDVLDNKIPEEKIIDRLISGRDDDFVKFKNFLVKDSGADGVQAFNEVKAQVLRGALDKATGTAGKNAKGQPVFNVNIFRREIDSLKRTKKYDALFNSDEKKLIQDIVELGKLRLPQQNVQQGKGPSELAVEELRRDVLQNIPLVGEKARGLIDAVSNVKAAKKVLDPTRETINKL